MNWLQNQLQYHDINAKSFVNPRFAALDMFLLTNAQFNYSDIARVISSLGVYFWPYTTGKTEFSSFLFSCLSFCLDDRFFGEMMLIEGIKNHSTEVVLSAGIKIWKIRSKEEILLMKKIFCIK